MIRHCVTFRFVDGATDEAIAAFEAGLSALPAAIDDIKGYWYGRDLGLRDTNADFAVIADFADEAGYRTYAGHTAHRAVIRDLADPIVAERNAVQFSW
ncbi:MAG: Dabb family protein [Acidimicrobiales bacterium]|nr:Dabb family protein [Acidimicrobiales bacterium]